MTKIEEIYGRRPFATRNADEYDLSQILKLFVSPLQGLTTPFDYENNIIKGRMGSGKTMYLRANHAFYLYRLVPAILDNKDLILPVMIRLNDFQQIKEPQQIYREIIIKIIEELASIYLHLQDADKMAAIHAGVQSLPKMVLDAKVSATFKKLASLGADEYVESVSSKLGVMGEAKCDFFKAGASFESTHLTEIRKKANPGMKDIENAYKALLANRGGKILLLIDEAGALDKGFFKEKDNDSLFEVVMNQLRTAEFVRTKIAIYPNSYQDILTETRYGDVVTLEESIIDQGGYGTFRTKTINLLRNYLSTDTEEVFPEILFDINEKEVYGDCLEQIINASNGNLRRLVQLLDSTMDAAYTSHQGGRRISVEDVYAALAKHIRVAEASYSEQDNEMLGKIEKVCKSRSTYKFQFPYMSFVLNKYTGKSQEYNLINIIEIGSGRRGTTYAFDYSYCVAHDIPTHYIIGSEKIQRGRTLRNGRWAARVAKISEETLEHATIANKIDGSIGYWGERAGFIDGDDNNEYFFQSPDILDEDKKKFVSAGRRVRFIPLFLGETKIAKAVELL